MQLTEYVQGEGFDPAFTNTAGIDYAFGIPLTFLGVSGPIIPLYVNSYVPPQPSMRRCFAFGEAVARGLQATGVRAVIAASGGMSHFPGTPNYSNPEDEFDRKPFEILPGGDLRHLLRLDHQRSDYTEK